MAHISPIDPLARRRARLFRKTRRESPVEPREIQGYYFRTYWMRVGIAEYEIGMDHYNGRQRYTGRYRYAQR